MQHLKHIKVFCEDLLPGLFVSELDRPWEESRFLLQGFNIESQSDLDAIRQECDYVYIDFKSDEQYKAFRLKTSKSKSYLNSIKSQEASESRQFASTLKTNSKRREKSNRLIRSLLDDIMFGRDFSLSAVRESVKENVKAILKNPDAMLLLNQLKNHNEDIAQHSLNVSIMSIAFAAELGYSQAELEDIGTAAVLHDVGLVKVDQSIVNKHGKLNQTQREAVQKHCHHGFDLLSGKQDLTPSCIDVVMSHHEQLSGEGYPRGLVAKSLTQNTRIVTITDVYDTLCNHQVYAKVSPVLASYKQMMKEKNRAFDEQLLLKFIKWRGIYPPGTIVEMKCGEVGIVLGSDKSNRLKPKVLLVLDAYKQPTKEKIINLRQTPLDSQGNEHKIENAYENTAFGVDIQEYVDAGLKIST